MSPSAECLAWGHGQISGLGRGISEDIQRYLTKSPHDVARGDTFKTRLSAGLTPEVFPVVVHRVAHYLYATGWYRLALLLTHINSYFHKVNISPQSCIGPGLRLPHPAGVTFHGTAGSGLTIYSLAICCADSADWHGNAKTGPRLGDSVTIGAHAVAIGRIHIGDKARIAYSVQLNRDAPLSVLATSESLRFSIQRRGEAYANSNEEHFEPRH